MARIPLPKAKTPATPTQETVGNETGPVSATDVIDSLPHPPDPAVQRSALFPSIRSVLWRVRGTDNPTARRSRHLPTPPERVLLVGNGLSWDDEIQRRISRAPRTRRRVPPQPVDATQMSQPPSSVENDDSASGFKGTDRGYEMGSINGTVDSNSWFARNM